MDHGDSTSGIDLNRARCPRCGYDQRGVIATWSSQCPLTGVCTECGLEIEWYQLLSRKVQTPAWCVEYAPARLVPRAVVLTLLRSLWPPAFWAELKLWHELRRPRMILYLVTLLVAGYLSFVSGHGFIAWEQRNWIVSRGGTVLPPTATVIAQAMAVPLSEQSLGMVTFTGPTTGGWALPRQAYPSPWSLFGDYGGLDMYIMPAAVAATLFVMLPVSFVALPISMRRARVRWSHIVRICVYALGPIVLTLIGLQIALVFFEQTLPLVFLPVMAGWILLWWCVAVRHYLRMEHWWAIFGSIAAIACICAWFVYDLIALWRYI